MRFSLWLIAVCILVSGSVAHAAKIGQKAPNKGQLKRALRVERKLGQELFSDINLSLNRNQSCDSCHSLSRQKVPTVDASGRAELQRQPAAGLVDPANFTDDSSVSNGSNKRAFGTLNAPSAAYAGFSPAFHWDGELFIGGQFWNGRVSNLEEQAGEPFLAASEMAMPSKWAVIQRLQERQYYLTTFYWLYGIDLAAIGPGDPEVETAYGAMQKAIASFERSPRLNRFDSKFDFEAAGIVSYNPSEQRGADLFDDKAKCGLCHVTEPIAGEGTPSLLTDFSYDNLGTPANPQIPGMPLPNPGLLGNPNLDSVRGAPTPVDEVEGRHKVMSLRNIAITAPYMHNGVFKTLQEVVHFYNTRDVLPECTNPGDATNPGFAVDCWPKGEFHATRNVEELGNLGLTPEEEADIVAYLKTFTDNYPRWGNSNGLYDPNVPPGTPSPFKGFVPEMLAQ